MISCPYCARLPQFLDRRLGEEECRAIELHIEDCPECGDELERLTASDGEGLPLPPVPLGDTTPPEQAPDPGVELPAVPGYQLVRVLGTGGMGIVYLAYHARLRRWVALKMIRAGRGAGPRALARFRIEAEALARLQHPHIIPIYEVGDYGGRPFFAMEYVTGGSLKDRLAGGLPPPREAAGLIETLARAIHYAHQRGVLHRDLTPANVLLQRAEDRGKNSDGGGESTGGAAGGGGPSALCPLTSDLCPKVTDFGLAKFLDAGAEQTRLTQSDEVVGVPGYMAPEQAAGKLSEVGTRTDVYGLGAILYKVLTGHAPFEGGGELEIINRVRSEAPPPPRRRRPEVPADLEAICLKCLEKEPDRRYASAEQLAEELRRFLDGRPLAHKRRVGPAERLWRWCRRNPALAGAAGLAACLLVATTVVSVGWAVHASRLAEDVRGALAESERRRAENHLDRGLAEAERGEVGPGLLWMARGLETVPPGSDDLARTVRANLAGWQSHLFTLTDCRAPQGMVLAFSPDGRSAWTVDRDKNQVVRRWDLARGRYVGPPLEHPAPVTAVATGGEGDFVLTAAGPVARLWEVATGKPGPTFHPPGDVDAVALGPDGRTVLTADRTQTARGVATTIRRWDARTGEPRAPTCHHRGFIRAVALAPDGRTLLATQPGDGAVLSWDVATGKPLPPLLVPRGEYLALAYSPDGGGLLTGSRDRTARLWDVGTGRQRGPALHHGAPVRAVAFSRDGRSLLTADAGKTARTWAVAEGPFPASVFAHDKPVRTVDVSPDGRTVATGCFDGNARLWSTGQGALLRKLPHGSYVMAVLFSPDGRTLLTADWNNSARLWDTASGRPRGAPLREGKWANTLAFSPGGQLVVTGGSDGKARIWDASTGAHRATLGHGGGIEAVAFDPRGARVVTGSADRTARVWDVATRRPLGKPLGHRGTVRAVAFDRKGERVLTAGADGTARLWDAATGQPVGPPLKHGGGLWVAAFSPDGGRILTAGADGTARLWDAATGQPRGRPLAHDDEVRAAAFGPDGRWVVTGSWDGTARLWDAATGRPLGPRLPHAGKVWAVACGAGSRMVLTGSDDGKARLWRVPPPVEGSVEEVVLRAQVLTGMEVDADGGMRVLDPSAWQRRRQRLEELGGLPAP